jgi:hypothetical protein
MKNQDMKSDRASGMGVLDERDWGVRTGRDLLFGRAFGAIDSTSFE